jgi:Ca2+-binding RTX toxin-like protein
MLVLSGDQDGPSVGDGRNGGLSMSRDGKGMTARRYRVAVLGTLVVWSFLGSTAALAVTSSCFGRTATIVGTEGNDTLTGTSGVDVIVGLGGKDLIEGRGSSDYICGGDETSNEINTGDAIYGGAGADSIGAAAGGDEVRGGPGPDRIYGGTGDDSVRGEGGNDLIRAGRGDDFAIGDDGADTVYGESGADSVLDNNTFGDNYMDHLHGGGGDDFVYATSESSGPLPADFLNGGSETEDGQDRCAADPEDHITRCESVTIFPAP